MKKHPFSTRFIILCATIIVFLIACTSCGSSPSKKQITDDLQEKLDKKTSFSISVKDYNVKLSETTENTFTASIEVEAKATYANFNFPADIIYKKYDQGWLMESCSWGKSTYELVKYPKEKEIEEKFQQKEPENTQKIDISFEGEKIFCRQKITSDCSEYAQGTATNIWVWKYNQYHDNWEYQDTYGENGKFKLSRKLEGKWSLHNENGYLLIENVTDTNLDVTFKGAESVRLSITDGYVRSDGGLALTLQSSDVYYNNGKSYGYVELFITLPQDTYYNAITRKNQDLGFTIRIVKKRGDGTNTIVSFVSNSSSKVSS